MTGAPPTHPDVEIVEATKAFERFLRVDVFRFRHRLFSGEWSGARSYDALRRGQAASIVLYDPDRESVVLVEQRLDFGEGFDDDTDVFVLCG